MKLKNLPPFKVGDRVRTIWTPRVFTVKEIRHAGDWQAKIAGYWITCRTLIRINENTTEESPSGAAVEEVMRSGNQYPPTRVVESIPSTDYVPGVQVHCSGQCKRDSCVHPTDESCAGRGVLASR